LIVSRLPSLESGDTPRLTTVAVEDLLLRPSENIDHARLEAFVEISRSSLPVVAVRSVRRFANAS
jgi:hypothetical protein